MSDQILDPNKMELEMLREFYFEWVKLHKMERKDDKKTFDAMKEQARRMLEAAHVVDTFRKESLQ